MVDTVLPTYPHSYTAQPSVGGYAVSVALRQSQGRKVELVNVEGLYDEFNFGAQSPYAVKSFLRTANSAWQKKPRWVLLVRDGTMDPRDYYETHRVDYLPAGSVSEAASRWGFGRLRRLRSRRRRRRSTRR